MLTWDQKVFAKYFVVRFFGKFLVIIDRFLLIGNTVIAYNPEEYIAKLRNLRCKILLRTHTALRRALGSTKSCPAPDYKDVYGFPT